MIGSTEVKNEVLSRAKADQIALTEDQLTKSFSLDRQDNRWVLRVRLNDPQLAQKLDRYWSESAMQALQTMKAKAVTGFIGQEYLNSLATCLQQSVVLESNSTSCNVQNIPLIQSEIKKAVDDPEMNLASSSLTLFHTSFQLTTEATLPGAPVLFSQNTSALAGMLIGLIIGLVLLSIDFPIWAKDKGEH